MNQMTKMQIKIRPKKAAVFLDRDRNLIHDSGHIFRSRPRTAMALTGQAASQQWIERYGHSSEA